MTPITRLGRLLTRPSKRTLIVRILGGALVAAWAFCLWPTSLGGHVGYVVVDGTSMQPRFHTGDLVLTRTQSHYHVGEIVAFHIDGGQVIHRLHSGSEATGFTTKGDNRTTADPWVIRDSNVVGKEWIHIPALGGVLLRLHNPVTILLVFLALGVLGSKSTPAKGPEPEATTGGADDDEPGRAGSEDSPVVSHAA